MLPEDYVTFDALMRANGDLPDLVEPRPAWQADALCRAYPVATFYPERGGDGVVARAVCGRCGVREACLADALAHGEQFGIWGGTSPTERRGRRVA